VVEGTGPVIHARALSCLSTRATTSAGWGVVTRMSRHRTEASVLLPPGNPARALSRIPSRRRGVGLDHVVMLVPAAE
jgi:hypothetical protein